MPGPSDVLEITPGFAPEDASTKGSSPPAAPPSTEPVPAPVPASDPLNVEGKRVVVHWPQYGWFAGICDGWRVNTRGDYEHHIEYDDEHNTWSYKDTHRWHSLSKVEWRYEDANDAPALPPRQVPPVGTPTPDAPGTDAPADGVAPVVNNLPTSYSGPTPNQWTRPAPGQMDPLKEPARPQRERRPVDRLAFSVGALAAEHVLAADCGYDTRSPRLAGAALQIDMDVGASRLHARALESFTPTDGLSSSSSLAMAAFADATHAPLMAGWSHEECTSISTADDYADHISAAYSSLEDVAKRAVCLALDYDDISYELGSTSPQACMARELYAAAAFGAASVGVQVTPIEPTYTCDGGEHRLADIFDSKFDNCTVTFAHGDAADFAVAGLAKKKSTPDILTQREMSGREWDEPKSLEVAKLERRGAMIWVPADDPSVCNFTPVDTMFAGRIKRAADLSVAELKARCVFRGDIDIKVNHLDCNQVYAPTSRNSSSMAVDAVSVLRQQHCIGFDFELAYLQGKQMACEQRLARPPPGFRVWDERGVEMLWLMQSPLYGQGDAGAIWNRTFTNYAESGRRDSTNSSAWSSDMVCDKSTGPGFDRCDQEPCIYSKEVGRNASRCTLPLYVDDGHYYFDPTPEARRAKECDVAKFNSQFKIKWGEEDQEEDYFLGANRYRPSREVTCVTAKTYITKMINEYCGGDVNPCEKYPAAWSYMPATDELVKAYEEAVLLRAPADQELTKRYGKLFGSLIHAVKYRPDIAAAIGLAGTCLTFPTERLYRCLVHILVYLGRTASLGTWFTNHAADKGLRVFADANWGVTRSVTGFVILLAGAAIAHASRRQHCISMSSCESELIALADCAIELLHVSALLRFIGYSHEGGIDVATDNQAAYDLCHRFSSAQHTRHIDRKLFKMRELRGAGVVTVRKVPTDDNPADLFTKILTRVPFERHRKTVLGLPGDTGVEYGARARGIERKAKAAAGRNSDAARRGGSSAAPSGEGATEGAGAP